MYKVFRNVNLFTGVEMLKGRAVLVKDSLIDALIDDNMILPGDAEIIDCEEGFLSPGLIDLQIAGGGGFLFSASPTPEALRAISAAIVRTGTTGYLMAVPTNTFEVYSKVIRVIKENPDPALLGIHLEGPFISPLRRGAHIKSCIKTPDTETVKRLIDEADGVIKLMTVAPEVCTEAIIKLLTDNNIVVSAGHSNATFSEAVAGFGWGISLTTHLFNAMSQLHHRDPGLPGATLLTDTVSAAIIADGIHVDYNTITIAKKLMGERLFLVSDAVEENNTGAYMHVRQADRYTLPDGTLSGSLLTMLRAAENCVKHVGIAVDEALRMASYLPARAINVSDRGVIEPGNRADLIVFTKDFRLKKVFLGGELVETE